MKRTSWCGFVGMTVIAALAAAPLAAQMEKRDTALYSKAALLSTNPAVGEVAPDITLVDVDGRPWALSSFKGRTVVLIKGGYT